ncbi:hypothetical protein [Alkalihalobacillus sp. AL-G]|uniref:hypothetical protein n=1 Tax=Alkalihalobacillus sp. AL-G TaxID=2926399 RepID=UPI00272C42A0|nr:hypothetical protein [Alkalihalobacillus sp. AL-G]WLD94100.1 hypothetical protein MOJ78_04160 [Alkalihalobacillus sp. AL-G]
MRIQNLIVKGIIASVCLLVPTEVLADGDGNSDDHLAPPVEKLDLSDSQNDKENGNSNQGNPPDNHGQEQKAENAKRELPVNANVEAHLQQSNGEEKRSLHVDAGNGKGAVHANAQFEKQHGKDQSQSASGSRKNEATVHSDRNKVRTNGKESLHSEVKNDGQYLQEDSNRTLNPEQKDSNDQKSFTTDGNEKEPKPLPANSDNTPVQTPVAIPVQQVLQISKAGGPNGDGQSSTSGNGFTYYGIASLGDGLLITLVSDYSNEIKRKHNQWINAPPSPPPKSNLL